MTETRDRQEPAVDPASGLLLSQELLRLRAALALANQKLERAAREQSEASRAYDNGLAREAEQQRKVGAIDVARSYVEQQQAARMRAAGLSPEAPC